MLGVTTSIYLDKRTKRSDGTHSVKLRITYNREQVYYPLGVYLSVEQWDKVQQDNPRGENKDHKLFFNKMELKAYNIIKDLDPFTFAGFKKNFENNVEERKDLFVLFDARITILKKDGRIATADSYGNALKSLKNYMKVINKRKLFLRDITIDWLNKYEKNRVEKGNSTATIGIYLRSLKAILNYAIAEGIYQKESYPFGKGKFVIAAGRNVKKALTISDVKKIMDFSPKNKAEDKARDLWMFSYLSNGINMKDIALLKFNNIGEKSIIFVRAKTQRSTKKDLKPVVVPLMPEIVSIIQKHCQAETLPDNYVFGILNKEDDATVQLAKIKQATKTVNKYMKGIGVSLGFDLPLTSYVARHTYATVMKRSGAPVELISENLGHKDLQTTENYLGSFEDDMKLSFQRNLLAFSDDKKPNAKKKKKKKRK